jgi:hypothetical protein
LFRVPGGVSRVPGGSPLGSLDRSGGADLIDQQGQPYLPYSEDPPIWGTSETPGSDPNLNPPAVGTMPSNPNAWKNPNTFSQIPILAATSATVPVLTLNYQRNALMIQNNSTATAPDTTPTFYIGFGTPVAGVGLGIALAAGVGIGWDYITPRDSVYILQAGGAGASLVVAGVVVQGTFAPVA